MRTQSRAVAAKIIHQVLQGKSLSEALKGIKAEDKSFIKAICYGTCRNYFSLTAILNQLLEKPLKDKDQDIQALLLVGLYQLTDMRIAQHAAVSETVAAAQKLKKPWAKNLVNAVLRNYLRGPKEFNLTEEATYNHPQWFIDLVKTSYPEHWQNILTANNTHPPLSLRVNCLKQTTQAYLQKLKNNKIDASLIEFTQQGITLTNAIDVEDIPGFKEGEVSVQDGAAQLAAQLLDLGSELDVVDACAAPDGKTAHIAELEPKLNCLIAIDNDEKRMQLIKENLQRLNLHAECIVADVADVAKWWNGKPVDRILLDAPCSATGVIRRHPDIKLLRQAKDISPTISLQSKLLNALWPLLKVNGILVYATCSILPEENVANIQAFLKSHPDAKELKIEENWGLESAIGRQILPGMHGMDGFYYARLRKCA